MECEHFQGFRAPGDIPIRTRLALTRGRISFFVAGTRGGPVSQGFAGVFEKLPARGTPVSFSCPCMPRINWACRLRSCRISHPPPLCSLDLRQDVPDLRGKSNFPRPPMGPRKCTSDRGAQMRRCSFPKLEQSERVASAVPFPDRPLYRYLTARPHKANLPYRYRLSRAPPLARPPKTRQGP